MDVDCGSARDRLGQTLGGRYLLSEVLGAGGTAVVYRAVSPEGGTFAVKILHDHLSRSEEVCRRFVREGQLGNVLDHPGTVRVLDHGSTEDGCPYLVLEFLEGESLEERRVRAGGRIDLWEALDFCDQLLAVLEVAHAKNIVHRDIKPSNLFVTKAGILKVLDFGIARLVDDTSATATKTGQMVGTPAFMPPEQALSRPRDVDARTDLWSVGATLFTLLSSEHVHVAESSSEHLVKAATLHARSLARALPGVPSNVEALVARCLAFDKRERWASATTMREELGYVRNDPGRRIGTSTSPPPDRTPSNPDVPTLVNGRRSNADGKPGVPPDRESNELVDANMSLTTNPGIVIPSRRGWLLPLFIAASLLLVATSGVALSLAIGKTPASQAAATQPPAPSPSSSPSTVDAPATAAEPAIALSASPAPAAPSVTPKPSHAVAPPRTSSPTRAATPAKKSAPASTSRKDLYRPF